MTKSSSLQSRIARVQSLLLQVVKTLNRSMPDILPEAGNSPKKENVSGPALDTIIKELESVNVQLAKELDEREKVSNAHAMEKLLLSVTLSSIGDAVVTLDEKGRIVLFNKAAELLTGWSFDEAAGKNLETVLQIFDEKHSPQKYGDFIKRCIEAFALKAERRGILRSRSGKDVVVADQDHVLEGVLERVLIPVEVDDVDDRLGDQVLGIRAAIVGV